MAAFAALALAALLYPVVQNLSRWPLTGALRHAAAAPNCTAARVVALAPAWRGQPGYYPQHDRERDGIACEPVPRLALPVPPQRLRSDERAPTLASAPGPIRTCHGEMASGTFSAPRFR
jgi:Excalibur calcium-binding domain